MPKLNIEVYSVGETLSEVVKTYMYDANPSALLSRRTEQ